MSNSGTVIQLLQARLERAIRRRRENPSRTDILVIPALALALDACGGGGSQRPTPPPPPPPPPPAAATITADAEAAVDENSDGGAVTSVATENTTSVTVDDDRFEVVEGNLKLKSGQTLDFESDTSPIAVKITASGDGDSATATVSVSINDVNEAPTISVADGATPDGKQATSTVDENVAGGLLGEITLGDPDAGQQTHTLSTNDARFVAKQDDGGGWWLALADDASLDYEEAAEVTVTVTATDDGDPAISASADVTITVNDINEAPSAPVVRNADMLSVDENDDGGTISSLENSTDPEGDESITYHVDDDRFEVDASQVLKLKDSVSLDHEEAASVELKITARDSEGNVSEATMVTVAVNDVNEPAEVIGRMPNLYLAPDLADGIANIGVNLKKLFMDMDEGDQPVSYKAEGLPSWMTFIVSYGTDADGASTITGYLRGVSPKDDDSVYEAAIIATDGDGAEARAEFKVVSDDGNDEITAITLYTRDSNGEEQENLDYEVIVDENDASGVMLGRLGVADVDSKLHPHGQHKIMVDDERFEIRENEGSFELWLKAGAHLDYEEEEGSVQVMVTALDINGMETLVFALTGVGTQFLGKSLEEAIEVTINDKNDAPMANDVGNWWVTVDADLDEDDVSKGEWLSFYLAVPDDAKPAFADQDMDSGDSLMYEIVRGPSWLEIDAKSGKFTNKEDTMPERGVYDVTVRATDQGADRDDEDNADGRSATIRFKISVALSDVQNEDPNSDNDDPSARITSEGTYTEGSGRRKVAAFTVTDDDQDIPDHPFAIKDVKIVKVENADDDEDGNNWMESDTEGKGYHAAFELELVENVGSAWTYNVYTTAKSAVLDHETVDDIKITVKVTDGVGGTDEAEIDIDIEDANEAPKAVSSGLDRQKAKVKTIEQSMDSKVKFYVNLHELFDDEDDDNDDNDLDFGVSVTSGASWIKVLHGPVEWSDIKDDVAWEGDDVVDDDIVVVFEVDRTGGNNGQGDTGAVKFTATDEDGATGESTLSIKPGDMDLDIPDDANPVRITGSTREGSSLRVRFDESEDPDLAGGEGAQLVFYQWAKIDPDTGEETLLQVTASNTLVLTQAEVDHQIKVSVYYYELDIEGMISHAKVGGSFTTAAVRNTPDRASAHFNFTTDRTALTAEVAIMDEDGVPTRAVTYTWQVSENGRGGWEDVRGDRDKSDMEVSVPLGRGYYYRVVVTYTDDHGGEERLESDILRLGALRSPQTPPEIVGSPNPGGTLSVKNAPSTATVQWQMEMDDGKWVDISGAGDELDIKAEYAGANIRALVTYMGGDADSEFKDDMIAVVPLEKTIGGDVSNNPPVVVDDAYEIEGVAPASGTQKYEYVIPLSSLFQDSEGDSLTYTIEGEYPLFSVDDESDADGGDSIFNHILSRSGSSVMLVEIEGGNARLTYVTDVSGGHDGDDSDGGGNVLTLKVEASDDDHGDNAETEITIRLNVAPTSIEIKRFSEDLNVDENHVYKTNEQKLVVLDVQDENAEDHKFGQHTFAVSDSRFEIKTTATGNPFNPTIELGLFVKSGSEFDYETEKEVKLTITATDGGGLTVKKPLTLTVEVYNDEGDDAEAPSPNDVPGLKDDDGDNDDVTDDIPGGGDGDGDNDGGVPIPPPPSASGFVDDSTNLNVMEEDLLDGFVLAIDDIDIA